MRHYIRWSWILMRQLSALWNGLSLDGDQCMRDTPTVVWFSVLLDVWEVGELYIVGIIRKICFIMSMSDGRIPVCTVRSTLIKFEHVAGERRGGGPMQGEVGPGPCTEKSLNQVPVWWDYLPLWIVWQTLLKTLTPPLCSLAVIDHNGQCE